MPLSEFPAPEVDSAGDELPLIHIAPPGPMSRAAAMRLRQVECPAFAGRRGVRSSESGTEELPILLASGRGSNVYDVDGNRYVDLCAGFGALLLGHCAKPVVRAIEGQSDRLLMALGDVYSADVKVALLERLASLHPGHAPKVLLCQSGSDAITAAMKTAMLATGRPGIVAFEGAYHGLGYAPLAACGLREGYRKPFAEQLNPHMTFVAYAGDESAVDKALDALESALSGGDVGAVVIEPILGRGGCVVPPDAFVLGVCEAAHRHHALVIADEIWTGLGRTGAMTRTGAVGGAIDILCLGKGLGGGLPISACIAPDAIMQAWQQEQEIVHTSTHSGLPVACAAALATLDTLRFRQLVLRAKDVGARFKSSLQADLGDVAGVVDVRGEGLMIGVELESAALGRRVMKEMLAEGYVVLTGGKQGEVITLTPALNVAEELLVCASQAFRKVCREKKL